MTTRKWRWAVMQTFRDGRTKQITHRPTKREAEIAAEDIADTHAALYGSAFTFTKRQAAGDATEGQG